MVDKHVESLRVPRLDEGSTPSVSTIKADFQQITKITPVFTPNKCKAGAFFDAGSPFL